MPTKQLVVSTLREGSMYADIGHSPRYLDGLTAIYSQLTRGTGKPTKPEAGKCFRPSAPSSDSFFMQICKMCL